jgi:hypothetical protein
MSLGLESVVEALRARLGIEDGQGDAEAVAVLCGLDLCPADTRWGYLDDSTIYYPRTASPQERQRHVARELGRWLLFWAGLTESDEAARCAGLLLVDGPSLSSRESGVLPICC